MSTDANAKHKIGEFKKGDETKAVYLLNPGDVFVGFGGSRSGLVVRKTASLIVRETGPSGIYDCEYDIADRRAWELTFRVAREWMDIL